MNFRLGQGCLKKSILYKSWREYWMLQFNTKLKSGLRKFFKLERNPMQIPIVKGCRPYNKWFKALRRRTLVTFACIRAGASECKCAFSNGSRLRKASAQICLYVFFLFLYYNARSIIKVEFLRRFFFFFFLRRMVKSRSTKKDSFFHLWSKS